MRSLAPSRLMADGGQDPRRRVASPGTYAHFPLPFRQGAKAPR